MTVLKNTYLLVFCLFISHVLLANEKFVKMSGDVFSSSKKEITDFDVKIVLDEMDSTTTHFDKSNYQIWLPANRVAKVYFIKDGFDISYALIDAAFIPSFAYKKKKEIDVNVYLSASKTSTKTDKDPFVKAKFKANDNKFILHYPKEKVLKPFRAPFPAPVDTYKGVRPTVNNLQLTENIAAEKQKSSHELTALVQGVIFAEMNYCLFNERVGEANKIIENLQSIDKDNWSNVKPFDSPEYGAIISKTLNNEMSRDSLFALGAWVGTSRLLFQNFTTTGKVIIHNKKLKQFIKVYAATALTDGQLEIAKQIIALYDTLVEVEEAYMYGIRNRAPIDLQDNEFFIQLKEAVNTIYKGIIE